MFRFATLFSLALAIGATWIVAPLLSWAGLRVMFQPGAIDAGALTTLMILLSVFTFVSGFWGAFFYQVLPDAWVQEAGGQPVSTDPSGAMHVQMPNFAPLRLLHVLALFVPFLMFLAVSIAGASMAAATIGWLVIFAALVGGPLWIVQRRRAGRFDLVLSSADVTVPAMHGRMTTERIARRQIDTVHTWFVVHRGRGGGAFYRVSLKTKDGREPMVAEWRSNYDRARALAEWLAKKLGVAYVDKC